MKILLTCCLIPGCALSTSDPSDDPALLVVASGPYQVHSTIDLTAEAVLPEPAAALVVTLRDFSVHPAHTLIDLADEAGVPAISELRAVLPGVLEDQLEGWLDDEIAKARIGDVPVTQLAGETAALAESALSRFALDSELRIDGEHAMHRLTAIDFTPAGLDARIAIEAGLAAPADATSRAGALSIGDHRFGLAYGEYLWSAADAQIAARFGGGLRAVLGSAVDCPQVARVIANRCVLGVCVGHASLLEQLCERGIDELVDLARDRVAGVRFDALRFTAGSARLVDSSGDGVAEAFDGGVWTAELNAGQGLRHVPATFTATR